MTRPAVRGVLLNYAAVKEIRILRGLSQRTVANEMGVTPGYVSNIEAGRNTAVMPDKFNRLVRSLRLTDSRAILADPHTD